jgi:hypothetical protein
MTAPIETDETDTTTTTEAADASAGGTEAPPNDQPKGNREARYRVERNQAREALTAAEARITAYQTREVERLASELAQPGDLLELGELGLSEYLTEDGDVDPDVVLDAVAALLEQRPGLALRPKVGAHDPSQGLGGGRGKPTPSWEGFLKS